MEHQYTDANISIDNLKGSDYCKDQRLLLVCRNQGLLLYVANLECKVSGAADEDDDEDYHVIYEESEVEWKLNRVFNIYGREVTYDILVDAEDIIQEHPLEHREPEDEDYGGWTGNKGAATTHW